MQALSAQALRYHAADAARLSEGLAGMPVLRAHELYQRCFGISTPISGDHLPAALPSRNRKVQARKRGLDSLSGHTVREFLEVLAFRRIEAEAAVMGVDLPHGRIVELAADAVKSVLEDGMRVAEAARAVLEDAAKYEPCGW